MCSPRLKASKTKLLNAKIEEVDNQLLGECIILGSDLTITDEKNCHHSPCVNKAFKSNSGLKRKVAYFH